MLRNPGAILFGSRHVPVKMLGRKKEEEKKDPSKTESKTPDEPPGRVRSAKSAKGGT